LGCRVGTTPGEGTCQAITTEALAGTLTAEDITWDRPDVYAAAPFACKPETSGNIVPFDSYVINNTDSTEIRVTVFQSDVGAVAECTNDLFLHVFSGPVDPANPLTGCVQGDDDAGPAFCGQLDGVLVPANGSVVVAVSTFSSSPTLPIAYQVNVIGFGSFTINAQ